MTNDLKKVRDALEYCKDWYQGGDCVDEAIEILDRMIETPAPQGWKTIDSAPKDGTEILLALWSGHPEHKTSFCWAINGHYKDGFFYSKDPMIGKLASPTHWQHITAPTPAPTEKYIDWDGLDKIRKSATGKVLDQLNAWCYANDTRKTGNNAPTEKVDLDALKREIKEKFYPSITRQIEIAVDDVIDHLANTGRLK